MGFKNSFLIPFLLFLYFLSLNPHVLHAADTLSANQFLSGDQTLISSSENFELGFFKAGKSSNYYIGLWYKKVSTNPPTIVWVANRETPVLDRFSSELRMVDGNLVLLNELEFPIWSTNLMSTTSSSMVAVLHDDGNLVLRDGSNSSLPLWQSFDFPTDTWLPGGKIAYNNRTGIKQLLTSWKNVEDPAPGPFSLEVDPNDRQYIVKWNRFEQQWTSGSWNGEIFSLVPEMRLNYIYNFSYVTTENGSYLTYSENNPLTISRFIMDVSGQVKQLTWSPENQEWNLFWTQPRQQCEVYAFCGAFGSCNDFLMPSCNCLTGFRPRSDSQWQLSDYSGGCMRRIRLQCGNTSGVGVEKQEFLMRSQVGLPQNSVSLPVGSAAECRLSCLNNCSCTAYAYDNNGCLIWNGNLLNLKELATSDGSGKVIYIKLAKSDIPSSKNNKGVIIGAVVVSLLVVVLLGLILFVVWRRRTRLVMLIVTRAKDVIEKSREDDNKDIDVPFFDFKNILVATDNFSDSNMLGKGGFGPVYKGKLFDGQEVAVKRLSSHSGQGLEEFTNEVVLIAKLQHRNLVKVLGYCTKGEEKIILYEFMVNKSLDRFIFDQTRGKLLDWPKRYEIILGITRGLLYLHQDSRLRIIHRDLKTSNILLDEEMNPKISDFGLARIVRGRETEANTERVVGTYGYMSPEYAFHGHFSIKSDVFSFGVLMLEIVSGKRNSKFYDYEQALSLSDYAWNLWNEEKPLELVDHTLLETLNLSEALKCILIGLLCVQGDPFDRPTMTDVALMLGGDIAKIPDPKKPAFVAREHILRTSFHKSSTHSDNRLTVSLQEGR